MRAVWRCLLPPLEAFHADVPLNGVRLNTQGGIAERFDGTCSELARRRQGLPLEFFLHPRDCRLTSLDLPALPPAKLLAAVNCAAQELFLDEPARMRVAHGPRGASGRVALAWLEAELFAPLEQTLHQLRLVSRWLLPTPFLLPFREDGWVACEWDGHLLVRCSAEEGFVHPLPEQVLDDAPPPARLYWLGKQPTWNCSALEEAEQLDDALRWSGPISTWGLKLNTHVAASVGGEWKAPLVCCAAALLVWVAGLNLYARQLTEQGQALQRQTNQRVQQAFPELPVVLDPLRQARERRDTYFSGKSGESDSDELAGLLRGAGAAMPFLAGRLQQLDYHPGELNLVLTPGGPPLSAGDAWQNELGKHGLQADIVEQGWQVRVADPVATVPLSESGLVSEVPVDE